MNNETIDRWKLARQNKDQKHAYDIQATFDDDDYEWFIQHPEYIIYLNSEDPLIYNEKDGWTELGNKLNNAYNKVRKPSPYKSELNYVKDDTNYPGSYDEKGNFKQGEAQYAAYNEGVFIPLRKKTKKTYNMNKLAALLDDEDYSRVPVVSGISSGSSLKTETDALKHLILDLKKDIKYIKDATAERQRVFLSRSSGRE